MKPGDLVMLRSLDDIIKDPTVVMQSYINIEDGIFVRRSPRGSVNQVEEGYLNYEMFPFLGHTYEVVGCDEADFIIYLKSPQTTDEDYYQRRLDLTCVEAWSWYPSLICDKNSTDSLGKRSLFFKKKAIPIEDPVKDNL